MADQKVDPRENINHSIEEGNVYYDSRMNGEEQYVIIHRDLEVTLLRYSMKNNNEDNHIVFNTKEFEKGVGSGRWKYQPEEEYQGYISEEDVDGEKTSTEDDLDTIDLEDVDGVGSKTAERLRNSGYAVKQDFRNATREELLNVGGVGETNLDRILNRI